jgi:gamma-glutamyltranspeptidase/glutathione hydrolase
MNRAVDDSLASILRVGAVLIAACAITLPAGAQPAAIAAPDADAAETAASILNAGGNAVDAAVAVAFSLSVTYPDAGNLGGGGFATVLFNGKSYFLDYRERAPAAATATMYLDKAGNVIADASTIGARAAGVPGTVEGLWQLHHRFGRLPWTTDLAPAIRLARKGFLVSAKLAAMRDQRREELNGRTNFLDYFGALATGRTHAQPELAATLERISAQGPKGFYTGETARLIVAEMVRSGGIVTASDLASYRSVWRKPLERDWQGFHVITAPLPSSGGIALLSLLDMKSDLAPAFRGVEHNSAQYVHLLAEIEKRVFADRAEFFGDPDFTTAPVDDLLRPDYLARRAAEVRLDRPTPTAKVLPGLPAHHNTTHFSLVDRWGNAVSNTYTLNDDFGSGQVVRGAGFLLNNEMDDFSVKPGTPNIYGVVGADANAIAPGKRPLSSMTPTILTRDGKAVLVIGTPGGSHIFTSVFQVLANWHDFGMPLDAAVAVARVHHQLLPADTIFEEPYRQLDPATVTALTARGYVFEVLTWNGDIAAVEINGERAVAVADPRGRGVGRVLAEPASR